MTTKSSSSAWRCTSIIRRDRYQNAFGPPPTNVRQSPQSSTIVRCTVTEPASRRRTRNAACRGRSGSDRTNGSLRNPGPTLTCALSNRSNRMELSQFSGVADEVVADTVTESCPAATGSTTTLTGGRGAHIVGVAVGVTLGLGVGVTVGVSVGVALQMSQRRCDRGLLEQSRGRAGRAEAAE